MTLTIEPEIQEYIDKKLTHQLHTSERRAFRACRRRWNWIYREMYYPLTTPEPLEFGVAFHKAMETFYEPRMWLSPLEVRRDLALVAFKQECQAHLKEYEKLNPDPDSEVLDSYKTRIDLGLNMLKYYCNKISPLYDNNWTPIRVEVSFEVPIKNPDTGDQLWCKCNQCWTRYKTRRDKDMVLGVVNNPYKTYNDFMSWKGLPVTYGGRLDALFQDNNGRFWVVDWKTTSRLLDEDAEASFLQLDDQINSYIWALQQYGINCAGFVYVEIKKAFPQAPERLTRLYRNRAFSTNKQALTTYEMALRTFQKEDNSAWQMGLYDEYLIWLKHDGPGFTQRHQIHKNAHEIEMAGQVIAQEAMDMIASDLRVYPQPGRFSCNFCLFKQPCLGMNMGEDFLYTLNTMFEKKDRHYWESKEASTD